MRRRDSRPRLSEFILTSAGVFFLVKMSKPKITFEDFQREAARLRCTVADIETVAQVESNGEAFYDDGFPVILFERHKFYKYCDPKQRAEWSRTYPAICNSKSGGYGKAGQYQRNKFNLAFSLDPVAAMKACSWGKFQICGFNYELCGFSSVGEFVDAMKESEGAQLVAFSKFVISCGLSDELRNHLWARFAQGYNGAKYKENHYDEKLAAAQNKFANHNLISTDLREKPRAVDSSNPQDGAVGNADDAKADSALTSGDAQSESREAKDSAPQTIGEAATSENTDTTTKTESVMQKVQSVGDTVQTYTEKVTNIQSQFSPISNSSWFMTIVPKVLGVLLLVYGWAKDNWFELVIAFGLIALAAYVYSQAKNRANAKAIAAAK